MIWKELDKIRHNIVNPNSLQSKERKHKIKWVNVESRTEQAETEFKIWRMNKKKRTMKLESTLVRAFHEWWIALSWHPIIFCCPKYIDSENQLTINEKNSVLKLNFVFVNGFNPYQQRYEYRWYRSAFDNVAQCDKWLWCIFHTMAQMRCTLYKMVSNNIDSHLNRDLCYNEERWRKMC